MSHYDTPTVGTITRGKYIADHHDEAAAIAAADPNALLAGETVRLPTTRIIVTVATAPRLTEVGPGWWTTTADLRAATLLEQTVHQQIEMLEASLRQRAKRATPGGTDAV